ncbi:MAG: lysoplasmalogenase [Pyrinomonadaceae bacterium]
MRFSIIVRIFLVMLFVESFANAFEIYWLQFLSKPSLMLILLTYFLSTTVQLSRIRFLIISALVFSWIGDVVLLIEKRSESLFVYGLIAFLAAHLCYVAYYRLIGITNREKYRIKKSLLTALLLYAALFYIFLFPYLGDLKFPVVIYTLVISLMLFTSVHGFDDPDKDFAKLSIAGTVLFVLSDSILAINRFVFPLPLGSVLVMLTYAVGQLLITEGAIRNLKHLKTVDPI